MTKYTKTLVSSSVPQHISKITRGLFSNTRVLQHTYKYLMHVSSDREWLLTSGEYSRVNHVVFLSAHE